MSTTRREQAEHTRELMLDAAADAFWHRGLGASRIQDVIDRTGLTRGAVYHHFKDKHDMAAELARREAVRWRDVIADISADEVRGLDALHTLVRTVISRCEDDVRARAVLRIGAELHDPEPVEAALDLWYDFAIRSLQQAIADGDVPDSIDIREQAAAFVDALYGACASQAPSSRETSAATRAERLWALVEFGLRRR